jgi:hypothetical protein
VLWRHHFQTSGSGSGGRIHSSRRSTSLRERRQGRCLRAGLNAFLSRCYDWSNQLWPATCLLSLPLPKLEWLAERASAPSHSSLHAERLRVLRVTMRTVQDSVNNHLDQIQLVLEEAEGQMADEMLRLFDTIIQETARELTAIGNMEAFVEKPMESGQGLDVAAGSGAVR